jgi:hypothetical protein
LALCRVERPIISLALCRVERPIISLALCRVERPTHTLAHCRVETPIACKAAITNSGGVAISLAGLSPVLFIILAPCRAERPTYFIILAPRRAERPTYFIILAPRRAERPIISLALCRVERPTHTLAHCRVVTPIACKAAITNSGGVTISFFFTFSTSSALHYHETPTSILAGGPWRRGRNILVEGDCASTLLVIHQEHCICSLEHPLYLALCRCFFLSCFPIPRPDSGRV